VAAMVEARGIKQVAEKYIREEDGDGFDCRPKDRASICKSFGFGSFLQRLCLKFVENDFLNTGSGENTQTDCRAAHQRSRDKPPA